MSYGIFACTSKRGLLWRCRDRSSKGLKHHKIAWLFGWNQQPSKWKLQTDSTLNRELALTFKNTLEREGFCNWFFKDLCRTHKTTRGEVDCLVYYSLVVWVLSKKWETYVEVSLAVNRFESMSPSSLGALTTKQWPILDGGGWRGGKIHRATR